MKIAVIGIRGLPANYSGFETCAHHVTKFWTNDKNEVLVYCRKSRYANRPAYLNNVRLKYISQISSKNFETLSHTLLSIFDLVFNERQYKAIHLYNTGNAIFLPLLKLFGKKVIISVDGIEWKRDKWGFVAKQMYKLGEKISIRFADAIISDNTEVKKYFLDKHNKKTYLIAYGAKMLDGNKSGAPTFLKAHHLERGKYFVFVGRLVPEKGVHNLIEAFKRLETDYPLVIIGDDYNESQYKSNLFLLASESVRFLGFKYGEEYEQLLVNSRAYVSASSLEGTSPSLLAAMGAGVCALVNGIPENRHTAEDAAFFFEENNFNDLTKVWQQLIDDPLLIDKMAEKGKEFARSRYSWEKIALEYIKTFKEIGCN